MSQVIETPEADVVDLYVATVTCPNPNCGSDDVHNLSQPKCTGPTTISWSAKCMTCDTVWEDVYTLTGMKNLIVCNGDKEDE